MAMGTPKAGPSAAARVRSPMRRDPEGSREPRSHAPSWSLGRWARGPLVGALLVLLLALPLHLVSEETLEGLGTRQALTFAHRLVDRTFTSLLAPVTAPVRAPLTAPVTEPVTALVTAPGEAPVALQWEQTADTGSESRAESAADGSAEGQVEGTGATTLGRVEELERQLAAASEHLLQAHGQGQAQKGPVVHEKGHQQGQGQKGPIVQKKGHAQGQGQQRAPAQGEVQKPGPFPGATGKQNTSTTSPTTSPIQGSAAPASKARRATSPGSKTPVPAVAIPRKTQTRPAVAITQTAQAGPGVARPGKTQAGPGVARPGKTQAGPGVARPRTQAGPGVARPGKTQAGPGVAGGGRPQVGPGVASAVPSATSPICWEAPKGASRGSKGGIVVRGAGCRGCTAGRLCVFDVLVKPPLATWHVDPGRLYKWDLMVTMQGPAMAAADVAPGTGAPLNQSQVLRAAYRIWDAGTYSVQMRAVCLNLFFPGRKGRSDFVGQWSLTVKGAQEGAGGAGPLPSPCDHTLHARWLAAKGGYRWVPFPCARATPPVEDIPALLVRRRGIREINLVGDSRLRVLTLHLYHLFLAGEDAKSSRGTYPFQRVQKRQSFSFRVPIPMVKGKSNEAGRRGGSLKLNYYFTDFILREDEYGCRHLWAKGLPPGWKPAGVSKTADVTLINVGSWTGANCREPAAAIASHMTAALAWASKRKKEGSKVVLRSASTMYRSMGCRATNSFLRFANSLGRTLCPRFGVSFFDSWQIEAPRFSDTCSLHDHHYSCIRQVQGGLAYMAGDVGEAVAMAFLHYLLYTMP